MENWQKDYPTFTDFSEADLEENNSFKKMAKFIENDKFVVDFGCATGYFAQLLGQKGCIVTGVEINPNAAKVAEQYCEQVIVADLDFTALTDILPEQAFDVAVFGDVLEHLRDPWRVLEETKRILKPDGYVVVSIPNVAHGAVRLALLEGKFEYEKYGLLDNTHLRFFTRKTVEELFAWTGYFIDAKDRTVIPLFSNVELIPQVDRANFNPEVIQKLEQEEDSDTLQFVLRAFPLTLEGKLTALGNRYDVLLERYKQLQLENRRIQEQLEAFPQTQAALQQTQTQLEQTQAALQQTQTQLEQAQAELQQTQTQLQQTQAELEDLQEQFTESEEQFKTFQEQAKLKLTIAETELHIARHALHENQEKLKSVRERFDQRLVERREELERAQSRITAMESSKFWQIRTSWLKLKRRLGRSKEDIAPFVIIDLAASAQAATQPPAEAKTDKQRLDEKIIKLEHQATPPAALYERWIEHNQPKPEDFKRMTEIMAVFRERPLISIVMPVYNTPETYLREAIDSVIGQIYPDWELCIADDASTEPHVRRLLEKYAKQDPRIKLAFRKENGHISRCSNSAIELATGEYIALLDHDDLLPAEALYEVVFLINQHPDADMIYTDEDKLTEEGQRRDPFFKPDWCPDSFLSRMYTCHFGVYRRSIIREIGGFRVGFEGSQDYDLVLRFTEKTDKIYHVPKILYHWRVHPESTAAKIEAKPYAVIAGEKALVEALERRQTPGQVIAVPKMPGFFTVRYEIQSPKLVSIIIPTRDLGYLVNQCLESVFAKTTYPNFEVILIDNGSTEDYTKKVINDWLNKEPERFRCYSLGIPFNYSKLNNYGVEKAKGEYLLFLNNDTEVVAPDWLEGMVEQAQRPSIGAVGATLLYADDTIQHSGVVMGMGGMAGHGHRFASGQAPGYFGQLITVNNYTAVTGACLMCRREVFEAVDGFNEHLAVAFNDIDLCLRIVTHGYRNIIPPHVVLYHYESKSRGLDDTPDKRSRFFAENAYMMKHWKSWIEHDPCYNPNLSLRYPDFSVKEVTQPSDQKVHQLAGRLKQAEKQLHQAQEQISLEQAEKAKAMGRVEAMESSKFWKLRRQWFQIRRSIGLAGQE